METHLIILHISDVLESNGNPIDVTHITKYLDSFGIKDCALEETLEYLVTEGYLTGPDKGVFSLTDKGRDQVQSVDVEAMEQQGLPGLLRRLVRV